MKGWFECDVCRGSGMEEVYGGHGTVQKVECTKGKPRMDNEFRPCFCHGPVPQALWDSGWFNDPGAYVLVDGQYGSTGKGLMASVLAQTGAFAVTHVTSNAGPNSGHTAYIHGSKTMTQQLPISSIGIAREGGNPITYLNAGAVIDPDIWAREIDGYPFVKNVIIHPCAAIIRDYDQLYEKTYTPVQKVASTAKGVGSAIARKILRENNIALHTILPGARVENLSWDWSEDVVLVEVSQGFSLGLNEWRFHPFTTSRECTVMQAISDARIPPGRVRKVCATYRTYPIRVGNTEKGNSGSYYSDQEETTWEALGLEPELTSVTKRVRRVFTWSRQQFMESVAANEPNTIFINFMNYIKDEAGRFRFINAVRSDYSRVMGRTPELVLLGYGPRPEDVLVWQGGTHLVE